MADTASLQENKRHGEKWFPFDIYPCTIPKDFPQVALHWQNSVELVFVKKGMGTVQVGLESMTAMAGDILCLPPVFFMDWGRFPERLWNMKTLFMRWICLADPAICAIGGICCLCKADGFLCRTGCPRATPAIVRFWNACAGWKR